MLQILLRSRTIANRCPLRAVCQLSQQQQQQQWLKPQLSLLSTSALSAVNSSRRLAQVVATNSSKRFYSDRTVATSMEKHSVVPDVISCAPREQAEVCYPSGAVVCEGNELTPTQVKDEPKVTWKADPNAFYTLCMTDPDAPSRAAPEYREWHHWLVGNIPGCDVSKGEVLSAYIGSGPPQNTGLHRYVFLIYKQEKKLEFSEKRLPNNSGDGRGMFKIEAFADKYKLNPAVAGNFYQAQWDEYVPILYSKLGL